MQLGDGIILKIEVYTPTIKRKEMDAVLTALVEDNVGPGELMQSLIHVAKEFLQFDVCLALRSPALALYLALRSLQLEDGQGVVVSALSPGYYDQVCAALRLRLLYCDVPRGTAVISRETIEAAMHRTENSLKPGCIVVNHTLGYWPDMPGIAELGLPIIEDCSRSFKIPMQSFGMFSILGLEERDVLTAGGGALLYGTGRNGAVLRGLPILNECSLPDLNAAMGIIQFKEAAKNQNKRAEIASIYKQAALRTRHRIFTQGDGEVNSVEAENSLSLSDEAVLSQDYNNYSFSLILETGMKDVKAYAKRQNIAVESAFDDTLIGQGLVSMEECPESNSLFLRTALFPLYPRLRADEIERVAKLITTLP